MPTVFCNAFARESAGFHRDWPTSALDLFDPEICRILVAVLVDVRQAHICRSIKTSATTASDVLHDRVLWKPVPRGALGQNGRRKKNYVRARAPEGFTACGR